LIAARLFNAARVAKEALYPKAVLACHRGNIGPVRNLRKAGIESCASPSGESAKEADRNGTRTKANVAKATADQVSDIASGRGESNQTWGASFYLRCF